MAVPYKELFSKWGTIAPCMPKYREFLKKTNRKDIKKIQVFMNESAQASKYAIRNMQYTIDNSHSMPGDSQ